MIHQEGPQKVVLYSRDGKKRLGVFRSMAAAKKREQQIEYFKHRKTILGGD